MAEGRCFYCNVELRGHKQNRQTREHIVPKYHSHFAALTEAQHSLNVVPCCYQCNNKKGGKHPLVWLRHMPKDQRPRLIARLHVLGFSTGVVHTAAEEIPSGQDFDLRLVSAPNF